MRCVKNVAGRLTILAEGSCFDFRSALEDDGNLMQARHWHDMLWMGEAGGYVSFSCWVVWPLTCYYGNYLQGSVMLLSGQFDMGVAKKCCCCCCCVADVGGVSHGRCHGHLMDGSGQ